MAAVKSRRAVPGHPYFLIFLVLCGLFSALLAAPATGSLKPIKAYSSIQEGPAVTQVWMRRRSLEESNAGEGRMDIELTDYPGPGANKGHEPVTPSKP